MYNPADSERLNTITRSMGGGKWGTGGFFFLFLDFVAKGRGRGEEVRSCACDNAARRSCQQSRGGRLTTVDLPA